MLNIIKNSFVKNMFTGLDNWLNPVFVKEIRQIIRRRYVLFLLIAYLLLESLIVGSTLSTGEVRSISNGVDVSSWLLMLLFFTGLFCVPVHTSSRLWKEVHQDDTILSTALTSLQIVHGKFFSGLVVSILLFSLTIPFVISVYLTRGLDLSEMFLTFYWLFLLIQFLNCCGIVVGTMKFSPVARIIAFIFGAIVIISLLGPNIVRVLGYFSGGGVLLSVVRTLVIVSFCEMFMMLGAGALSPGSFNRMTYSRIFVTAFSVILLLIGGGIVFLTSNFAIFNGISICLCVVLSVFLMIGLCERTELSPRQIRQISHNPLLRLLYFPFFTGVGSAVAWFMMMLVLFLTMSYLIIYWYEHVINSAPCHEYFVLVQLQNSSCLYFLLMCLGYFTIGFILRILGDYWHRVRLAQRIPEFPSIVVYPTPKSGMRAFWYTIILIITVTLMPLFFEGSNATMASVTSWFSPVYYLCNNVENYGVDYQFVKYIPSIFGTVSGVFLSAYSVFSFVTYCKQGSKMNQANRQ